MSKDNLTFWQEAVGTVDGSEWNDGADNGSEGWTDSTDSASTGWTDGGSGDVGDTEDVDLEESTISDEEEMAFWEAALEDGDEYCDSDFGSHGEFIKSPEPPVDETEPQIKPEKDNYGNDPEEDKGADDLMKEDNSTVNVEIESFFLI